MPQKPYTATWLCVLATLTALGPFSIDMYLSALPSMAKDLHVTTSNIASTLPAYFMGLAFGQLIYGPLTDHFGRRKPLFFGLMLYVLSSLVCVFATQLETLILARIAQALGGCVGVVVARSAIRDRLEGAEAAQAFSSLMAVQGLAPVLAPLFGSVVLAYFEWRAIFICLFSLGTIALIFSWFHFPETLPKARRKKHTVYSALHGYVALIRDAGFIIPSVASGLLMGLMFTYINSASELFIDKLHASTGFFSVLFSINAFGLVIVANINRILSKTYPPLLLLKCGGGLQFLATLFLLFIAFSNQVSITTLMVGLFFIVACVGLVAPNATVLALASQGQQAGQASALLGALQFFFGLISGAILAILPLDLIHNMTLIMLLYSAVGVGLIWKITPLNHTR
ncbi:multidrug effflux MFS transporter [Acinetobacter sp. B10A]|uniref:multidrug effflux MFS transporter n=1 Tax=Acinetobacter baretiae TaxID=2605383 RepID=UPI001B3C8D95|nr:multidrug effflux MFS transporter [Acinetobacter baretiae]MBF7685618.1 multidrug effflux MFS transporter [Acinetobacter baretiae]